MLAQHFVEGVPLAQIAEEMHLSERQVYRDLARGEEGLADLLASHVTPGAPPSATAEPVELLQDELQTISLQPAPVDVAIALNSAAETVTPLASERHVTLDVQLPAEPLEALARPALLRQTLVQMLSVAIRSAATRQVRAIARCGSQAVTVAVSFPAQPGPLPEQLFSEVRCLAQAQRLGWRVEGEPGGQVTGNLILPTRYSHIALVVEDNKGAIELYRRFLAGAEGWELAEAADPRLAFEMARTLQPSVVILDILMPQQDGWSVLQMLRTQPETMHIPVLVCSVFAELDLAAALGASAYLKKPVSQLQLLAALQRCLGQ